VVSWPCASSSSASGNGLSAAVRRGHAGLVELLLFGGERGEDLGRGWPCRRRG
jgi:hypothetical protein